MMINVNGMMYKILLILGCVQCIWCHARLMEPPSRSSMWRHGYDTPKNYDDDGLYCGGMHTQWNMNGGKCGVCGDPWHLEIPRPNENGGKFGNGIIVRTYKPGQVIPAVVDITANHRGYFEFRICANKNRKKEVTQECLDQNVLHIINSTSSQYHVGEHGRSRVTLALQLPKGFTCKYCVFQWTYIAGNNWGRCKNGSFGLGCGAQETFKACADVSINERTVTLSKPTSTTGQPSNVKPVTVNKPTTVTKPPKANRFKTTFTIKPISTTSPNVNKNKNKKPPPIPRPTIVKGETFQEALDRIRKDPRLRWMLERKKPS